MTEEPIVDPASQHVLVPLDQWPPVHLPPEPVPTAKQKKADALAMKEHWALEEAARQYAIDRAAATAGMSEDELNAWCHEMEAWNDAVAGAPRHAVQP